jgi:DivIVA domain-containing protein
MVTTVTTPAHDKSVDAAAEAVASPFPFAPRGEKGYDPGAVDEFLRRARAAFEEPAASPVTASDAADVVDPDAVAAPDADADALTAEAGVDAAAVRSASFALVRRGYAIGAVDAALGRIEDAFAAREREARIAAVGSSDWVELARSTAQEVLERLSRAPGTRFRKAGVLRFGYRIDEVDIVAEKLVAYFEHGEAVTVEQVRAAAFRMQRRGYDEAQVDAVLDAVVEVMLAIR